MEYLNRINVRNRQIVQENDEILGQMLRVKQGTIEQQKMRKEMQSRLDIYEKRKAHEKKAIQSETSLDEKKMSSIARKLMEPARDKIRQRRLNTHQFFNRMNKTQIMDTKLSKRLNHPSSKLFLDANSRQHTNDFLGLSAGIIEPKLLKRQNENPEEFKLKIHSSLTLKNPAFFQHYYGGGPSKFDSESGSAYYATDIPKFKGTELEHKAITLLKAQIMGWIQRDLFRYKIRRQLQSIKFMRKNLQKTKGRLSMVMLNQFLNYKENKDKDKYNTVSQTTLPGAANQTKRPSAAGENIPSFGFLDSKENRSRKNSMFGTQKHAKRGSTAGGSIPSLMHLDFIEQPIHSDRKDQKNEAQKYQSKLMLEDENDNPQKLALPLNPKTALVRALKSVAEVIIEKPGKTKPSENTKGTEFKPKDQQRPRASSKEVRINTENLNNESLERTFLVRPSTATHEKFSTFKTRPQTAKANSKIPKGPIIISRASVKNEVDDRVETKNHNNTEYEEEKERKFGPKVKAPSGLAPKDKLLLHKRIKSEPQREAIKTEVIAELEDQVARFSKKAPVRGLLLKQRKLLTAAKMNNLQLVLSSGFTYLEPDVNVRDDHHNTALYYTARNGNMEFCQFLVDHGANPNHPCDNGNTPLHMAFLCDKEAVIIMLLIKNGNLNNLNNDGLTPLAFGSERVLTLLDLKAGIATYTPNDAKLSVLPSDIDNNYLLNRGNWKKPPEEVAATLRYKAIESPREPIRLEDRLLATYVQPGSPSLEKIYKQSEPEESLELKQQNSVKSKTQSSAPSKK